VFSANENGNDSIAVLDGSCTEWDYISKENINPCEGKQGIIFVHGFTVTFGSYDNFGGGTGTWGETFNYVLNELSKTYPNVAVYEFKWKTNSRFEEQAYYLSKAIKEVASLTGVKPIVVAHSFGGTLAATYVTGNAEQIARNAACSQDSCIPKVTQVKYDKDIAELITIGSPLSGIVDSSSKNDFKLPLGRDPDDPMISKCGQMTCAEAGFEGTVTDGIRRYYNKNEFASYMTKESYNTYKFMGVNPQYPGYLISKIHAAWKNGVSNPPRLKVLVGMKTNSFVIAGDGLISTSGQMVLPGDFSDLGILEWPPGNYSPPGSTMPNLTYYFMFTKVNSEYIGFGHTYAHSMTPKNNFPEVNLPRADGKIVTTAGTIEHPLATNLKVALAANPIPYTVDTKEYAKSLKALVTKKRTTYKALTKSLNALSASSTGAPFPYVFTVTRISTGEQIARKDGYTDATGNLNVNVKAVTKLADTVSTDDLKITLVIGDPTNYFPKEIVIDNWTDLLTDLGTIELESRDALPTQVSFSGSVVDSSASATPLSGATIKLKIGDNLAQQAFANLADSTTTRILTADTSGGFAASGLLPGRYTAFIIKSGYMAKRQTFDIPDVGLSGQKFVLQSSTPTGTYLTSIAVTPASPTMTVGATQQFTATGTYSDNSTKDLTSSVTWSSSATTVATIASSGKATAVASGSATITAILPVTLPVPGSISGTAAVTVSSGVVTGSIQLPKTGQTTSYAAGDDGALQKGVAWPNPRFTDNGNGTVTDNLTGLIWLKNANCFSTQTWSAALTSGNTLASGACGLTDGSTAGQWRLPNRKELQSLVDRSKFSPALPTGHPFTSVQSAATYWSSSTYSGGTSYAWYVYMLDGGVYNWNPKSSNLYVWPVRGGAIYGGVK
jgi:uncharacterized protein YjdB